MLWAAGSLAIPPQSWRHCWVQTFSAERKVTTIRTIYTTIQKIRI